LNDNDKKYVNMGQLPLWSTVQQQHTQSTKSNKRRRKPQPIAVVHLGNGPPEDGDDGEEPSDVAQPKECCVALSDHILYLQHYIRFIALLRFDYELSQYELDFSQEECTNLLNNFSIQIDKDKVCAYDLTVLPMSKQPLIDAQNQSNNYSTSSGKTTFVAFGTGPQVSQFQQAHTDAYTSPTSLPYAKIIPDFLKSQLQQYARSPLILHLYHQSLAIYHEQYPSINFKKNALKYRNIAPPPPTTAHVMGQMSDPNDTSMQIHPSNSSTNQYNSLPLPSSASLPAGAGAAATTTAYPPRPMPGQDSLVQFASTLPSAAIATAFPASVSSSSSSESRYRIMKEADAMGYDESGQIIQSLSNLDLFEKNLSNFSAISSQKLLSSNNLGGILSNSTGNIHQFRQGSNIEGLLPSLSTLMANFPHSSSNLAPKPLSQSDSNNNMANDMEDFNTFTADELNNFPKNFARMSQNEKIALLHQQQPAHTPLASSPSYVLELNNVTYAFHPSYYEKVLTLNDQFILDKQFLFSQHETKLNLFASMAYQSLKLQQYKPYIVPVEITIPEPGKIPQIEQFIEEAILSAALTITPVSSLISCKKQLRRPTNIKNTSTRGQKLLNIPR
jgi:hypothetical protein